MPYVSPELPHIPPARTRRHRHLNTLTMTKALAPLALVACPKLRSVDAYAMPLASGPFTLVSARLPCQGLIIVAGPCALTVVPVAFKLTLISLLLALEDAGSVPHPIQESTFIVGPLGLEASALQHRRHLIIQHRQLRCASRQRAIFQNSLPGKLAGPELARVVKPGPLC